MGRQNWFAAVGDEHRATRERVSVCDESSFAKYELVGADAESALDRLRAGNPRMPEGRVLYTRMLNSRGRIECDLTVTRLARDRYYLVTGTGSRTHAAAWIRDHIGSGVDARLLDVTEEFSTLGVVGPRSRELLSRVSTDDFGAAAFPYMGARRIELAGRPVLASRVGYVAELGWEPHVANPDAPAVFDALMDEGGSLGVALLGYRAVESLRLEKANRAWGADITANDNPYEAGLGFAARLNRGSAFIGREALSRRREAPPRKRLASFICDDGDVVLIGRETILRDGEPVGYLTSGGYGYTLGRPIGLGYLRRSEGVTEDWAKTGHHELEVARARRSCRMNFTCVFDPEGDE